MSQDEFTKLSEKLDKRFDKIDGRFDKVDSKLENHDRSFEKMFKHMQTEFGKLNHNLETHIEDSRREHAEINGSISDLGGQIRDYHHEMIMFTRQVDRLERWIHEIAKQTGVKLSEA